MTDTLMQTCAIEKRALLSDDTSYMVLTQYQDMIQTFAAQAADEALADQIGLRSTKDRV